MAVRDAELQDIPALLRLGAQFHGESGYGEFSTFDPQAFSQTLSTLIQSPNGFLAVTDHGFLGGLLTPFFFNFAETSAQEVFWFVSREGRQNGEGIELLEAFERWSESVGAKAVVMLNIEGLEGAARLYSSRGYSRREQSWMRVH